MRIPILAREAAMLACSTLLLGSGPQVAKAAPLYMDCGSAPLCGVLALETGLGAGNYQHDQPAVHGLWPEVDQYGSSQCIRPRSSEAPPKRLYSCYADGGTSLGQQVAFESYEWKKHGVCAGTRDESDFFEQVCALSRGPLATMAKERSAGTRDLNVYARRVEAAGYDVYAKDERTSQLELSACAGPDAQWVLAKPSEFGKRCGGASSAQATAAAAAPSAAPSASQPVGAQLQCVRNVKGPACSSDADCGYSGCLRCAKSGFCTDQALQPKG